MYYKRISLSLTRSSYNWCGHSLSDLRSPVGLVNILRQSSSSPTSLSSSLSSLSLHTNHTLVEWVAHCTKVIGSIPEDDRKGTPALQVLHCAQGTSMICMHWSSKQSIYSFNPDSSQQPNVLLLHWGLGWGGHQWPCWQKSLYGDYDQDEDEDQKMWLHGIDKIPSKWWMDKDADENVEDDEKDRERWNNTMGDVKNRSNGSLNKHMH